MPQFVGLPHVPGLFTSTKTAATACTLPDGTGGGYLNWFHCYTPQDIRSAYGVDGVDPITVDGATVPN